MDETSPQIETPFTLREEARRCLAIARTAEKPDTHKVLWEKAYRLANDAEALERELERRPSGKGVVVP